MVIEASPWKIAFLQAELECAQPTQAQCAGELQKSPDFLLVKSGAVEYFPPSPRETILSAPQQSLPLPSSNLLVEWSVIEFVAEDAELIE